MSGDKIQRQMDFMLAQHALFNEQHALFNEQHARFNERMIKLEEKTRQNTEDITRLVGAVMNLTLHVEENTRQIAELIEHGKETDNRIADQREESDARINALIEVVERYFSNGKQS